MNKVLVAKILGYRMTRILKTLLNKGGVDESGLIYETIASDGQSGLMLDVGAHKGSSLLFFAGSGWSVHAFEPDPKNRTELEKFSQKMTNVEVTSLAVSDESDQVREFFSSDVSSGISSLTPFHSSHESIGKVTTITLRDYMANNELLDVGFLKIDTEGHDLFVLKGYPWEKSKPKVILCEFEDRKTEPLGYKFEDLANYLLEKGYHVIVSEWHPVVEYGTQHEHNRFVSYPCHLEHPSAWGNLIAIAGQSDLAKAISVISKRFPRSSAGLKS